MSSAFPFSKPVAFSIITLLISSGNARADEPPARPSRQQLLDRLGALQEQVDRLTAQVAQEPGNIEGGSKATAEDPLEREARQASALTPAPDGKFTAGYRDGKFLIQSNDNRYVIHPWLQMQFRHETTYRADAGNLANQSDTQNGFEIRRLKLGFDGNVISPDLTYLFQFAADRKTGNFALEQAYGKYRLPNSPFYLKAGQYKEPVDHEQLLASRYLTAIDRTLTNEYIHLDPANLPAAVNSDIQVFRAGVNYYLHGTEARLTFDVNYLPNGPPITDDGIGLLSTGAARKGTSLTHGGGDEVIFRAQLQLAL
ncbi:MAG TPA: porin [Tepidisphaeraceae bacterium]|nr:porin [Tepidisphaeraceae bacterium]